MPTSDDLFQDFPPDPDAAVLQLLTAAGTLGAAFLQDLMTSVSQYAMVPWDEVNEMAADGWTLVPIPPVQGFKKTLGGMTPGPLEFVMERKVTVPDPVDDDDLLGDPDTPVQAHFHHDAHELAVEPGP